MQTTALVPVEEYLNTSYDPDCEYVDGVLVERNVGEYDHSDLQGEIIGYFRSRRKTIGLIALPEQRVRVSATRYRIPDICLLLKKSQEQVLTEPPFAVIEILSACDRQSQLQEKMDDYLRLSVPHIWVIDPRKRRVWIYTAEGSREVKDGILRTENPAVVLPLVEIFANLD